LDDCFMKRAFIVRPFETKEVSPGRNVDFERIERELIAPALEELKIHGRTTAEILHQGEIQSDMFHRLVTAQLVIADISMANANVFYELGIRHALQDRYTVLIKFPIEGQKAVFDIATDRYLLYDPDHPGASVEALVKRIRATLDNDESDSPVFRFLPSLKPQEREAFIKLPREFTEAVELAQRKCYDGDLETFAAELLELDIPWASAGLRLVGNAQFKRKAWDAARVTWEAIRETSPYESLANRRLATIYQKQPKPDLENSDQAVQRVLEGAEPELAAELHSLRGSNQKTQWLRDWQDKPDLPSRRLAALTSLHFDLALDEYHRGFSGYLNHYYSGINALALSKLRIALAKALPDIWNAKFLSDEAAQKELCANEATLQKLEVAVRVSLDAPGDRNDPWRKITCADYACLTSDRPQYVRTLYESALGNADPQSRDATRRQLKLLQDLEVCTKNATVALEYLASFNPVVVVESPQTVLVFSGHRLDAPGRKTERFPARSEALARSLIREKLIELQTQRPGCIVGYAGCASGGDILFHETCDELAIPTTVLLAGPRAAYVRESVQDGGLAWVRRADAILESRRERVRELTPDLQLPRWLRAVDGFSIWQHNNLWTLHTALAHGGDRIVLLALWNGESGDGPGGTEHMVAEVAKRGGRTEVLDARRLVEKS
jgi:hypothetical protein